LLISPIVIGTAPAAICVAGERAARAILPNQTPTRLRGAIGSRDAFGGTALRRGRSFGERLDFERRRCTAAKLPGEKIEILLDPAQERVQVRLVAHIGGIAGRERGAVKGEAEDAMTPRSSARVSRRCSSKEMPSGVSVMRSTRWSRARMPGTCSALRRSFIVNS
jgi:hypothetical protein